MEVNKINNTRTMSDYNLKLKELIRDDPSSSYLEDSSINIDKNTLNSAISKANKVLFKNKTYLKFEVHDKTSNIMVKIIDDRTGDVLKEFPPEKVLDMVAKLWEIVGIFVDEKR